ncbi:c-type cytochrome [Aurantibacter crassamenti]|uniref:PVC-type heme-binding CxxCH protein n=1 Tax=Aurantibacter crassamenti TaxID=1837375 RepID=UPI00193A106D|nr:PVC-type heme-binding CxxCH protein [Aurantibacter crassamenti]MBM1106331.1 c-type cytochrome [Aurantibacter crassamenti]
MKKLNRIFKYFGSELLFLSFLFGCNSNTSDELEEFRIHPDFKLELVASEPLVFDPVEMRFDENNRTYVLEMPGYPFSDVQSRLVELIDVNGDGKFDERKVLDDSLGVATSFMPYKEGFLVASPPNLLFIKDTNNDGKIDERLPVMGGFSNANLQHNFNGLTYGLDNWIYAANGGNSGKPYFKNDSDAVLDIRGMDLKFDIEAEEMKIVGRSSGGYKLTFDNWGHMFETHNLTHVSHLVYEDKYLKDFTVGSNRTLVNISDHEENGSSRIYPIGEQETRVNHPEQSGYFSGSCGITYYGGGAFPEIFNNNLLVADCVLNLIHLDILSPEGSTFKTSRNREKVEFLASADRSFRPVNMSIGPDGALFVVDIHREVIEHPEWIPDEMEEKMDLNSGKNQGRIYKIVPKNNWQPIANEFNKNDVESLVTALGSSNQWSRNMAQQLLVTNKMYEAKVLLENQFNNSKNEFSRLHSLWSLEGLGALEISILKNALHDTSAGVRENAIKIAERKINTEVALVDAIVNLMQDQNAHVRLHAILCLSTLNKENYSIYEDVITKGISKLLSNTKQDEWAIIAIATAVEQQGFDFAQELLISANRNDAFKNIELLSLLFENIAKDQEVETTSALINTLNTTDLSADTMATLLEALADGWKRGRALKLKVSSSQIVSNALNEIESENEPILLRASGKLRKVFGISISNKIKGIMRKASQTIFDENSSVEKRLEQLQLLDLDVFESRAEFLYKLLENNQPVLLQEEAINQLSNSDNHTIGKRLIQMWPSLSPMVRKKAINILLYKSYNHDVLLTALENDVISLGELNLDLERRRTLLMWSESEIQDRAKKLFSDAGVVKRKDAIDSMRPSLELKGNSTNGASVFTNLCAQCHQYGNQGMEVGPVLTEVNRKSKESLLYDILDPNAAFDTKYLNHQIKTKDGNILTGLVFLDSDTEIGLKMIGGKEEIILKSNIEKFTSLGSSMMIEGFEASLSHQEMADLLAFLQQ